MRYKNKCDFEGMCVYLHVCVHKEKSVVRSTVSYDSALYQESA